MSSSPSNTPPPHDRGQFPELAVADDVAVQHRLLTEHFGIERLHAVLGWSMGAQQAYEWAARFPVDDRAEEAGHLPLGELRVVDTPAGHFAMFGLRESDIARIGEVITEMLMS